MADHQQEDQQPTTTTTGGRTLTHHVSGKSMLCASLAGAAIGGPLFGMMGFSFLATVTLLLISSPVLLIFSPLLVSAVFVLVRALTGFTAAIAMGIAGVFTLAWICREVRMHIRLGFRGYNYVRVKEQTQDFTGYLQQRVDENSTDHEYRLIQK
ncbi:hypothetical protein AB3S75_020414 [Citrus x aurantiifolia]